MKRESYFTGAGAEDGGSSVWVCPAALMTCVVVGSCRHIGVPLTQGSSRTSAIVARFLGSISSILPIICLVSLGNNRNNRHGPLITSCFFSPTAALAAALSGASFFASSDGLLGAAGLPSGVRDAAIILAISVSDFDLFVTSRLLSLVSVGDDAKSLYELSVIRGIFQGKRRRDMQQNMIARDQISAGRGSYFLSS